MEPGTRLQSVAVNAGIKQDFCSPWPSRYSAAADCHSHGPLLIGHWGFGRRVSVGPSQNVTLVGLGSPEGGGEQGVDECVVLV